MIPTSSDPADFAAFCYETRAAAILCKQALADYHFYGAELPKLGD